MAQSRNHRSFVGPDLKGRIILMCVGNTTFEDVFEGLVEEAKCSVSSLMGFASCSRI